MGLFVAASALQSFIQESESPRWLWSKNRRDEAHAVAHKYMEYVADMIDVEHEPTKKGSFGHLFYRRNWRATLFASMF